MPIIFFQEWKKLLRSSKVSCCARCALNRFKNILLLASTESYYGFYHSKKRATSALYTVREMECDSCCHLLFGCAFNTLYDDSDVLLILLIRSNRSSVPWSESFSSHWSSNICLVDYYNSCVWFCNFIL